MRGRSGLCFLFVILMLSGFAGAANSAEDGGMRFGFEGAFMSQDNWRGINWTDGFVFQPNFWLTNGVFTFDVWGNMDLSDKNNAAGEFSRVNYTVSVNPQTDMVHFNFGATHYTFPSITGADTTEIFAGAKFIALPFDPSITVFWDVDAAEGAYISLGAGGTLFGNNDITGLDWVLNLGLATDGYNDLYFNSDSFAFNDLSLEVSRKFAMNKWYIKPAAGFSTLLDSDIRDNTSNEDNFWVGVFFGFAPPAA